MVWPFKSSTYDQLIQIQRMLYQQSVQLGGISAAMQLVEMKLNGYVDPKLQRSIAKLSAAAEVLGSAMQANDESKSSLPAWRTHNTVKVTGKTIMSGADLSDEIAAIETTIGIVQSATTLISGFQSRLDTAVSTALANGATAEQLQPLSDLSVELATNADALAAAVAANTPA